MSMNSLRFFTLGMVALAIAGCQNMGGPPAPIVDKRPAKSADSKPRVAAPKGHYIVQRGDTLFRIAQDAGQSVDDLVAWNNLANPDDIKVDQVLRVIPPENAPKTQTASVSAPSGVEVRPSESPSSAANKTETPTAETSTPSSTNDGRVVIDGITWVWPTEGTILHPYSPSRKGIAIAGQLGQAVVAAGSGTVLYASSVRGYGNLVIVKHSSTLLSAYAHNKTILVKEGQSVTQGQKIAEMGDSDTDQVKLHFEIRQQGKPVDPTKYLPSR
jgi:lipoprotein NlpD